MGSLREDSDISDGRASVNGSSQSIAANKKMNLKTRYCDGMPC